MKALHLVAVLSRYTRSRPLQHGRPFKFGPSIFPLDLPRGREALERLGVDFGELPSGLSLRVEDSRAVSLSNHLSSWNGTSASILKYCDVFRQL